MLTHEYKTTDFGLKLRYGTNIRDIDNPYTPLGKWWSTVIRDLQAIGGEITEGATFTGPGAANIKVPTALIGADH